MFCRLFYFYVVSMSKASPQNLQKASLRKRRIQADFGSYKEAACSKVYYDIIRYGLKDSNTNSKIIQIHCGLALLHHSSLNVIHWTSSGVHISREGRPKYKKIVSNWPYLTDENSWENMMALFRISFIFYAYFLKVELFWEGKKFEANLKTKVCTF